MVLINRKVDDFLFDLLGGFKNLLADLLSEKCSQTLCSCSMGFRQS